MLAGRALLDGSRFWRDDDFDFDFDFDFADAVGIGADAGVCATDGAGSASAVIGTLSDAFSPAATS
ncbi:hypothetical protein D3C83_182180 [compost metagenome]